VAACYVAPVAQWEKFEEDWSRAERAENFGTFHMADFVGRYQQFAVPEWANRVKRDRVLRRLINVIQTRARISFFSVVEKRGYDLEMPKEWIKRHHLGSHYTFAIRMCMGRLLRWRKKYNHTEAIQFVFDRMSRGKGEVDRVFEHHLVDGKGAALEVGIEKGGWGFGDKAMIVPLQAADILAWETLWFMKNVVLPPPADKKQPRKSYRALLKTPYEHGYHDQESLSKLVAHWKKNKEINFNDLP
jgi:hypothetical protein